MINELKRNASGYYDPTAYEAIRKVDGEMNMNPGEIWEVSMNNGRMSTVAVLSVNDNIVSCVPLFESRRNDYEVEVKANGIMFANTAMVKYEYVNCFVSFIRLMKDDEFEKVKESVAEHLGISVLDGCENCGWNEAEREYVEEQKAEIQRLNAVVNEYAETISLLTLEKEELYKEWKEKCETEDMLIAKNNYLLQMLDQLNAQLEKNNDVELIKAQTERDMFKSLYEQTLERLLQGV